MSKTNRSNRIQISVLKPTHELLTQARIHHRESLNEVILRYINRDKDKKTTMENKIQEKENVSRSR
jgi:hypothetical protein